MSSEQVSNSVHWSYWVIGTVGLVFNLLGCVNFVSQMNADNVAAMPDAYRMLVENRPAWGTAAFAIAVFGGFAGCILLLLRQRWALHVFALALAGTVLSQLPLFGMTGFPTGAWVGWAIQLVVAVFFTGFAWSTQDKLGLNK